MAAGTAQITCLPAFRPPRHVRDVIGRAREDGHRVDVLVQDQLLQRLVGLSRTCRSSSALRAGREAGRSPPRRRSADARATGKTRPNRPPTTPMRIFFRGGSAAKAWLAASATPATAAPVLRTNSLRLCFGMCEIPVVEFPICPFVAALGVLIATV